MRSYETARGIFGFLEFTSWAVVVVGLGIVVFGFNHLEGYDRAIGISAICFGFS